VQDLSGDIESNPGPDKLEIANKKNMFICSYNTQGLKEHKKLKRVINFFHKQQFAKTCIINLQETHIDNPNTLGYHWRSGYVQSKSINNAGGVAILYNADYFDEIIDRRSDNNGRICSFTASKNDTKYMFINIHAPNDHYKSIEFFSEIESWIFDELDKDATTKIILSGDFNFIFDQNRDSIGRSHKHQEKKVAEFMSRSMTKFGLIDTYREIHQWGGFTWGRNNPKYIRSRLDHIIISKSFRTNIIQCYTTKLPNESDHNLLYCEMNFDEIEQGPGIRRCNADLLENKECLKRVQEDLLNKLNENTNGWNPHMKLDYAKMNLRNTLIAEGRVHARKDKSTLFYVTQEINQLSDKLDKLLIKANAKNNTDIKELLIEIDNIKESIDIANVELEDIKKKHAERLIFRSKVKWAEEGEKSTKYFLNLIKERQAKLQIRKLTSNGINVTKQDEISKMISKFYKELYAKQPELKKLKDDQSGMFNNLPELSATEKEAIKLPLTLNEMYNALMTCDESAPGPDGITYGVYKKTWDICGPLIFNSWEYSNKIGTLSATQKDAAITLLEKKGKDRQNHIPRKRWNTN